VTLPIVTLRTAARMLGVTADYLRHAVHEERTIARRLEIHKIGRDWYIPKAALDAELRRRADEDR
jgi:excisionase family DNA binding protein